MSDSDELFMEELKQEFKEAVVNHLNELPLLFQQNKMQEIAKIAHDIKGTAGVFGYDEGTDIAKDLQYSAQENDRTKTEALIAKLAQYMKDNDVVQ